MLPQLNWTSLCDTQKSLAESLKAKDNLVFTILFKDGQTVKKIVQFRDFLKFFWYVYDSKILQVQDLIVSDATGSILYKYLYSANEKLPKESNDHTVQQWNSLTPGQKDSYLKILYAQLQFNK